MANTNNQFAYSVICPRCGALVGKMCRENYSYSTHIERFEEVARNTHLFTGFRKRLFSATQGRLRTKEALFIWKQAHPEDEKLTRRQIVARERGQVYRVSKVLLKKAAALGKEY